MKDVINNITNYGGKGVEQRFGKLFWTNGRQINITDHFFEKVSFKHLYIGTRREFANISHISSDAFRGISHRVKSISIRSEYLKDERNLFNALRQLPVVESITVEGLGIQRVPENAFRTPESCYPLTDCVQNKLKSISFRIGIHKSLIFLQEIESYAFYDLPNLISLNFDSHDINYIHENAFTFRYKSNEILTINLTLQWDKNLSPDSFDLKAFEQINRPIFLNLYGNRFLTYLPEQVFRPLLEANSQNRIRLGMKMDCDCNMYWLFKGKQNYEKQFIVWSYDDMPQNNGNFTIQCSEGIVNFWDRNDHDFKECEQNFN
jgi:hypothetical protein